MTRINGVGYMENGNVNGVIGFAGGTYDDLNINGVNTAEGSIDAKAISINGVFNARGDVVCTQFDAKGVATIDGNLRTTNTDISGVVTVRGGKVEADRIVCEGVLTAEGQVSADFIDAQGFINAKEIVGDRITIQSYTRSFFFKMWESLKEAFGSQEHSKVGLIEATTITLRGVHADVVSGHDVTIGPGCKINRLDASGQLFIDQAAEVAEVINEKDNGA